MSARAERIVAFGDRFASRVAAPTIPGGTRIPGRAPRVARARAAKDLAEIAPHAQCPQRRRLQSDSEGWPGIGRRSVLQWNPSDNSPPMRFEAATIVRSESRADRLPA